MAEARRDRSPVLRVDFKKFAAEARRLSQLSATADAEAAVSRATPTRPLTGRRPEPWRCAGAHVHSGEAQVTWYEGEGAAAGSDPAARARDA